MKIKLEQTLNLFMRPGVLVISNREPGNSGTHHWKVLDIMGHQFKLINLTVLSGIHHYVCHLLSGNP